MSPFIELRRENLIRDLEWLYALCKDQIIVTTIGQMVSLKATLKEAIAYLKEEGSP